MKIKTSELTGIALDWAVAKVICGLESYTDADFVQILAETWRHSSQWAFAGPIIERERVAVWWDGVWHAKQDGCQPYEVQDADKPLIAAMRCYVASKLGNEVDVPDELAGAGAGCV